MNRDLIIKICGMRDAQNIGAIDALNPDYLGFIFYAPSPRFVSAETKLPETRAKKAGVFVDEKVSTILHHAEKYQLKTIQLHGGESVQTCQLLVDLGYEVFKAFRISAETTEEEIRPYAGKCHYFLYDTRAEQHGGTGRKFDWTLLEKFNPLGPFLLSGGISPGDAECIRQLNLNNLKGLDLNSRFEVSPALKNKHLLQQFFTDFFENNKTK